MLFVVTWLPFGTNALLVSYFPIPLFREHCQMLASLFVVSIPHASIEKWDL